MEQIELEKQTGNSRYLWSAELTGNEESCTVTYRWGKENGKFQEKRSVYSEGCQGRSSWEQAEQEMQRAAELKVRTRAYQYVKSTQAAKRQKNSPVTVDFVSPLPMLAAKWEDHESKLADDADVYVQPKLDGIRCLAHLPTGKLFSRQRKPIDKLEHIEAAVRKLSDTAQVHDVEWLDGELYVHGKEFQDVQRLVRGEDPQQIVCYHVYDAVVPQCFAERYELLRKLFVAPIASLDLVVTEPAFKSEVEGKLQYWIDQGYEGCMVRLDEIVKSKTTVECAYELGKRSQSLLKCKEFEQEEFRIVGFEAQKRSPDKLGALTLQLDDGSETTFNAQPNMSSEAKEEMWRDRDAYIGQIATVKFFERHQSGIPRFPKVVGVRHPDDM